MCGIFGIIANENSGLDNATVNKLVNRLFVLSESRGKESAGIAIKNTEQHKISILKKSVPASKLIKSNEYKNFYSSALNGIFDSSGCIKSPFALIAHSRLVTNGSQENNNNNQPCIKDGGVAVHNGIITNVDSLWKQYNELERIYEVDTEILISIIRAEIESKNDLKSAILSGFRLIEGTASIALLQNDSHEIAIATNNGSLFYLINETKNLIVFASEKYILEKAIENISLKAFGLSEITWLKPGEIMISSTESVIKPSVILENNLVNSLDVVDEIINFSSDIKIDKEHIKSANFQFKTDDRRNLLEFNVDRVRLLKRCSKCVLPETFPYITYDTEGICNYCNSYIPKMGRNREVEFKDLIAKFRGNGIEPNCIVPFSGGRDSSYGLHYIVKELGLRPVTYTYDWGMVTDLARRNIARVCGKLGIENIIVSADLPMKRKNISLNVSAWLKRPELGMIPLFMAGDKQFLHYVNVLKKQTGISLNIWSTNILENTDFKTGFCGISPSFDKTRPDYLPLKDKIHLASYYLKNFATNPSYLNSSIVDTIGSFYSYYAAPRENYFQLFDWIVWDERLIEKTLFEEYNWEISPDTTSTWRIGDGTASFYNYIYYTVTGFSEFDTFRSNQIREGLIDRENALDLVYKENAPRFESMVWYLETIGIDFERAISVINNIPKLYK